jgi:hypothetical protein
VGIFKPTLPRVQRGHPLARGLVGAWEFTEGSGLTAYDSSGLGNHAAFSNAPIWAGGNRGSALSFNGTSNYLSAADSPSLQITQFTIAAWVKVDSFSDYRFISNKGDNLTRNYEMDIRITTGKVNVGFTQGGVFRETSSNTSLSLNAWYFVSGTYNGATIAVYINGALDASVAQTGNPDTPSNPLFLGSGTSSLHLMSGQIGEILLYNRGISAAEIALMYTQTGP